MSGPQRTRPDWNGDADDGGPRPASGWISKAEAVTYGNAAWVAALAVGALIQSSLVVAGSIVLLIAIQIGLEGPFSTPSLATLTDADSWILLGWVIQIYAVAALIYFRSDDLFWVVFAWFWVLQLAEHRSWVLARLGVGSENS